MIHSMTGFGRGEATDGTYSVQIEISSLNRKQAEVVSNLPRDLSALEPQLRKLILERISRGRIQVQFTLHTSDLQSNAIRLDTDRAQALDQQFRRLSQTLGRDLQLTAADLLTLPNMIIEEAADPDVVSPLLEEAATKALHHLLEMREREGRDLLEDTERRLRAVESIICEIEQRAPTVVSNYRNNLITRLAEVMAEGQAWQKDDRIVKEIALYADRSDISEEVTRFRSHLDKFQDYLIQSASVGRSLDFLCQEFNRELNTMGAKANDATLAQLVVEAKTEIEKIREQIQNVE